MLPIAPAAGLGLSAFGKMKRTRGLNTPRPRRENLENFSASEIFLKFRDFNLNSVARRRERNKNNGSGFPFWNRQSRPLGSQTLN
jgi:hypothetical protein